MRQRWFAGVPPLIAIDLALFLTLHSRPGPAGPLLWTWGPPLVAVAAAMLLILALLSSMRERSTLTARSVAALAGLMAVAGSIPLYRTYPSSHDGQPSPVQFRLPLEGRVTVAWGGSRPRVNYHVGSPPERWAYDLLLLSQGLSYQGTGTSVDDYFALGRVVLAPADGRVVTAVDRHPDQHPGQADRLSGAGNHVVLEVAPHQYLFVAHLKAGSVRHAVGQLVRQGDRVGDVGNSGNSSEPHVHLHLQDTPVPGRGEGIPFGFSNTRRIAPGPPVTRFMPEGGMRGGRYTGETVIDELRYKDGLQ